MIVHSFCCADTPGSPAAAAVVVLAELVAMGKSGRDSTAAPVPYYDFYTFEPDSDDDVIVDESARMYADEASLYSIAEDSREDAVSMVVGRSEEGVVISTAAERGSGEQKPGEFGVELSLDEDDRVDRGGDDDDGSAAQIYDLDRRARRRFFGATACLFCLLLALAAAVTVSLTQSQGQQTSKSAAVEGNVGGSSTVAPTLEDTTRVQAETLVALAIGECPGPESFFDEATPQGQVFQAIIDEVVSKASFDSSTGEVTFDPLHGFDYLQEKFALGMLFFATGGHDGVWDADDQWMTDTDPCDGWTGVVCDAPRIGGTCAVTGLELGKVTVCSVLVEYSFLTFSHV